MIDPNEQRTLEAALDLASRLDGSPAHTVAAAAMDTTGRIHTSVNAFHFTGGPCAELAVIAAAAATGAGPLVTMVAAGDQGRGVVAPCGRCRQVLLDLHPDCHVVVPTGEGIDAIPVRALLPFGFRHPDSAPARFICFNPRYYDAIATGRKTATIRHHDPVAVGPAILQFEDPPGYRRLNAVVDRVDSRRLDQLTDEDARLEAVESVNTMRRGLRSHYPDLADDATVDVVRFHLVEGAHAG